MKCYTYQWTAAENAAKKNSNKIGHVSRVRVINESAVNLEFKLEIIMRPLEK